MRARSGATQLALALFPALRHARNPNASRQRRPPPSRAAATGLAVATRLRGDPAEGCRAGASPRVVLGRSLGEPPCRAAAMRVTQICLRGSARVRAATAAGLPIIPLPSTARQRCALPLIIHHRLTITSSNVASSQRPSPSSLAPVSTISAWVPAAGATPSPADPLASLGPCPAFLDLTAAESPVSCCRLHADAVRLHFAPLQRKPMANTPRGAARSHSGVFDNNGRASSALGAYVQRHAP